MQIKLDLLPHIYGEDILNVSDNYNKILVSTIELIRRGDKDGRAVSNTDFGFQSDFLPLDGIFSPLVKLIEEKAWAMCKQLKNCNVSEVIVDRLWANINYKNDVNWEHVHEGDISGVYYVNAKKNCGDLVLKSRAIPYTFSYLNSFLLDNFSIKVIPPQNKKLVLFDATLHHCVKKNLSDELRISMSFNIILNGSRRGSHEIRTYLGKGKFKNT